MKLQDNYLPGTVFDKLILIKHLDDRDSEFKCACEKIKILPLSSVIMGYKKTCGCGIKNSVWRTRMDIKSGMVFGHLTCLGKGNAGKYIFQCKCGNTKQLTPNAIFHSKITSCGCARERKASLKNKNYKYEIGEKMNKLTLIERIGRRNGRFKCDCGGERICTVSTVFRDCGVRSCGCDRLTLIKRDEFDTLLTQTVSCSRNRSSLIENTLTKQDIIDQWIKQNGKCAYSGVKLIVSMMVKQKRENIPKYKRASVDKIDPEKGYIKGNIQFVSVCCNYAKNNIPHEDMQVFINLIKNNGIEPAAITDINLELIDYQI